MDNYGYPTNTASSGKPWGPIGVGSTVMPSYPTKLEAERVLALDTLSRSIGEANGNLSECISALREIADSVFGPNPPSESESVGATPRMGRIDGLSQSAQGTHELIRLLRTQIERFRNL